MQVQFVVASDDVGRATGLISQELRPTTRFVEKGHAALVDLAVLALCCEHSVLSVGSFGWWAAFLREQSRDAAAASQVYLSARHVRVSRILITLQTFIQNI